jgi:TonB-linked SusC/RagA family outer membrane protein
MKKSYLLVLLFLIGLSNFAFAQDRQVSGKVTSATDGIGIPGVNVIVKGTTNGAVTDGSGNYVVTVPAEGSVLVFSSVGSTAEEITVGNQTVINVALVDDIKQLGEIIVTGYSTVTKEDLSSSIAVVGGQELAQRPNPSVDQLLQGRASGVQVTAVNGKPGANAFIRIRGTGSITGGNQPLLVVNGVQIPDEMRDQFMTSMNANDIESISVLKDAAAASIYGARGSNGVLVITTKSGASSKGQIKYSFQSGINEKIADNFEMMNSAQKLQYEYDLGYENPYIKRHLKSSGFPSSATIFNVTPEERQSVWNAIMAEDHNWQDDILRTGRINSHQISSGGTTGKANYYFSLQKFDQQGIVVGSDFNRYAGNLSVDAEVKPWLTIGNVLQVGHTKTNETRDRNNVQNPFRAIYDYNPYEPVFTSPGVYNYTMSGFPILEALKNNPEEQRNLTGMNALRAELRPFKGLTLSSKLATSLNDFQREYFLKPNSVLDQYVGDPQARGSKTDNGSRVFGLNLINQARYNFKLGQDHSFNVGAIQEFQKSSFSSYRFTKKGFATGDLTTQDAGAANDGDNRTTKSVWAISSLAGTFDYAFKNRYFLTGSLRRDGSSRFGRDNQYGNFWSTSAGWLISGENFMQQLDWISVLKLRGSVGTVGNFAGIEDYQSLGLYGFGRYNGQIAALPIQVENRNLSWERRLKRNVGVDFEIFQSRFAFSADYYNELTQDLLLAVPLSRTTGFSSVVDNVGSMVNKGVEFTTTGDILRAGDFTWSINGNITFNKNEVVALNEGQEEIVTNGLGVFKPGYANGTYKLVRWAGVNPENGKPQYLTKDGEITNTYSASDAVVLEGKSPNPKFFGGFGTSMAWKGFDVSAQFNYVSGAYTYNYMKMNMATWGVGVPRNQSTLALDSWKKPGDNTFLPEVKRGQVTQTTDQYLQKSSFMRFRNLTVGYTVPKSLTSKIHMQQLRVYVQGQNLFTYNPHFFGDPEVGNGSAESNLTSPAQAALYSYPQTRQFTFGVDVSF